jgi:hypothetical protein
MTTEIPTPSLSVEEKIAALRAKKADRETARAAEAKARELEALELEERFESELGPRGVAFELVETEVGNFVVARPDYLVAKSFLDKDERSSEDTSAFVAPCIRFPAQADYRVVTQSHGGIVHRCCLAALAMYEAKRATVSGKY